MKHSLQIFIFLIVGVLLNTNVMGQPLLEAYNSNPVLEKGQSGEWDSQVVFLPQILVTDTLFYLFYTGNSQMPPLNPNAIGYAYSNDGYNFTKDTNNNPILTGDGSGFDSLSVVTGALLMDGDSLVLYYSGAGNLPEQTVGRATATHPAGPWDRRDAPVLQTGNAGEWDNGFIHAYSVMKDSNTYIMFYTGGDVGPPGIHNYRIGMATSTDGGINWIKYDDPNTTTAPYADSDPVLKHGPTGSWDDFAVWLPSVIKPYGLYEMFYSGSNSFSMDIGYAESSDGIIWTKPTGNPIYSINDDPYAVSSGGIIESPAVGIKDNQYFMYYDYGLFVGEIGLATALRNPMTINVPNDYPKIQAGIDAAINGDTVLVADSTYYENINFKGKAITVASRFLLDGDTSHISNTIIDGSQPSNPDSGSVVYFVSGEDTNSILCGFTVTGGTGTFVASGSPPLPPFNLRVGGGILIGTDVGARIINNNINNNSVSTNYYASGGGIQSDMSGGTGYTIIENNTIRNNSAIGEISYTCGGAICLVNSGRITKNIISNNLVYSVNFDVVAGGIRIVQLPGTPVTSYCIVEENIIKNNQAVSDFGYAHAAGLNSSGINITLRNNTIINNTVSSNFDSWSAAMHIGNLDNSSRIENNRFSGNHSTRGTTYGGALYIYNSYPFIVKNIIDNNSANYGGGIYLNANSRPHFINNKIVSNSATSSGGGIYSNQCDLLLENSILWDNSASNGSQIYLYGASDEISYSDIQGGWTGIGNINADPLFSDTLYHLGTGSPCIDAGNPDPIYNDPEDPNNPGFALWPAMGGLRNDMGAYGGPHELVTGIIRNNNTAIPSGFYLSQNYPNPFNPSTTIAFDLPKTSQVILKIFNILGQEVETLVSDRLFAGSYSYNWNAGSLASGVYLYRLEAEGFVQTRKMILMK